MLLESLLLRGQQIKNAPLPYSSLSLPAQPIPMQTDALRSLSASIYSIVKLIMLRRFVVVSLSSFDVLVVAVVFVAALLNACAKWH